MKDGFVDFRVGDKVWDMTLGWGEVTEFEGGNFGYVMVTFPEHGTLPYNRYGVYANDSFRTLWFDEIIIPEKAIKRPKFRASKGKKYWYVSSYGIAVECLEENLKYDDMRYGIANYFETKEEAENSALYKAFQVIF